MTPYVLSDADAVAAAAAIGAAGTAVAAWISSRNANRKLQKTVEATHKEVAVNGNTSDNPTLKDKVGDLGSALRDISTGLAELKGTVRSLDGQLNRHITDASARSRDTDVRVTSVEALLRELNTAVKRIPTDTDRSRYGQSDDT